ncbi:hypothetical protein EFR01_30900 [Sinorhizobium fredii]|nr:hypothetical protein EFR01_30900 [Sinorhizobium fredii]GLS08699.1 hypothetical protein GCM10007864_23290 [Sinorhizobium fredii]
MTATLDDDLAARDVGNMGAAQAAVTGLVYGEPGFAAAAAVPAVAPIAPIIPAIIVTFAVLNAAALAEFEDQRIGRSRGGRTDKAGQSDNGGDGCIYKKFPHGVSPFSEGVGGHSLID